MWLALRELEAATCLGTTVLLALNSTAVTCQEAALFQDATQAWLKVGQRTGDAMTHRTGLTRKTTTIDGAIDIHFGVARHQNHRLRHEHAENRTREVGFNRLAVDRDFALAALDPIFGSAGRTGAEPADDGAKPMAWPRSASEVASAICISP
jgi:hypothetical protein